MIRLIFRSLCAPNPQTCKNCFALLYVHTTQKHSTSFFNTYADRRRRLLQQETTTTNRKTFNSFNNLLRSHCCDQSIDRSSAVQQLLPQLDRNDNKCNVETPLGLYIFILRTRPPTRLARALSPLPEFVSAAVTRTQKKKLRNALGNVP